MKEPAAILTESDLAAAIERERAAGRTVAFANGCFDILHVGHLRYLAGAGEVADVLIVAINSDDSVRELKGAGRPVMPEGERAEMIASLRTVDYVTVFADRTPARLLSRLRPDFQCKGTDYTPESVPEAEVVASYGGRVVIVGDPKDHSTTDYLRKLGSKQ
ncbi:MAG: adenylyltransferase/cytidyltransferase family protein [Thermoanaerobaculia bacterium]|nr:adenylyltransferase/cytidyltransferase family protein [Thermoanaerobaculia bacterium]